MLTERQRQDIGKTLDANNKEGILYLILDNITRVFQPFVDVVGPQTYAKDYEINEEGLLDFQRDIHEFEEGGYYWEEYRLYEYDEETDDEVLYFDFNQDIMPVIDIIRDSIIIEDRKITLNIPRIHNVLHTLSDRYSDNLGIASGVYYYAKDSHGEEFCKYYPRYSQRLVPDGLDLANILEHIAGEKVLQWFDWDEWKSYYDNRDTSDCYVNAKVRAVKKKLKGCCCGFELVTHPGDDLNTKYEVFVSGEVANYLDLIQEYAKAKKYLIAPVFLRGCQITKEEANEKCMYALAKEIKRFERLAKKKQEQENQ